LPEQHWLGVVQTLPRVVQPPPTMAAHLLETQLLLQHSPFAVQACVSDLQTAALHLPLRQEPLQQSVEIEQVAPAIAHVP
jgi:hypothetical protein